METYLASILIFIFGAAVGSFVNVIALRWNTGLSFISGKSRCLFCNTPISGDNLIPIFSFINLQGRCAHCKTRLSISYLLVEVFSGILALLAYLSFSAAVVPALVAFLVCEVLVLIFVYDLRHKIIPDPLVFTFIGASFVYSVGFLGHPFFASLLAAILVPLPFYLIWKVTEGKSLGFGDVKFMAGMGMLLGLSKGFAAVFLSFWLGAIVVIALFLRRVLWRRGKHLTMKSEIPFAPFLVLGTLIEFFFPLNLW